MCVCVCVCVCVYIYTWSIFVRAWSYFFGSNFGFF